MELKTLRDLLEHEIQDLYSAETQLIEALPKMAAKAQDAELKKAFKNHLEETKKQKERLEKVAEHLEIKPKGETCQAMKGLIKEGEKMIHEDADADVKDAGLIGCAQRVEHYEIAGYGTARYYALMLGLKEVEKLLSATLKEEKGADKTLNDLAINRLNAEAQA